MKNKTVMVTGAGGFIGKNIIKHIKNKYHLIPVDYKSGADLLDKETTENLPYADVVIHLAGKTFIPFAWDDPHLMYNVNINTTLNMLEFARRKDIKKFIFPSTYVYGQPQYLPIDEKHPINASNPYARSKLIAEELCKAYSEDYNIDVVILRLFNIYGTGQPEHWLIPTIISQLPSGTITLNDGAPKRDFTYISDIVDSFQLAIDFQDSHFEVFNIGSGISHRVADVVELILRLSNARCNVIYKNERRKNEIMDVVADISKAKKILKWKPKVTFEEGLKKMITDYVR